MTHLLTSTFPCRQSTCQLTAKAETAFAPQPWWNTAEATKSGISCLASSIPHCLLANTGWILTSLKCQNNLFRCLQAPETVIYTKAVPFSVKHSGFHRDSYMNYITDGIKTSCTRVGHSAQLPLGAFLDKQYLWGKKICCAYMR